MAEDLEDRHIAFAAVFLGLTQDCVGLALIETLGRGPYQLHLANGLSRILPYQPFDPGPTEELAQGSESAVDGRGGTALHIHKEGAVLTQVSRGHALGGEGLTRGALEPVGE